MQGNSSKDFGATRLGFGCAGLHGAVSRNEAIVLLETALDNGITHFDTARVYGWGAAERMLGDLARRRRAEMVIVSKAGIAPPSIAGRLLKKIAGRFSPSLAAAGESAFGLFGGADITQSVETSLAALGTRVLTTDSIFELPALPRSIGIVGLGAIGLELGLAFSRLGVDVLAGDLSPTIAGIADPVVAARARLRFAGELTMWLGHPLEAHAAGSGVTLRNAEHSADVDVVLAALGRRPNVEGLALAAAGVRLDARGQPVFDTATLRATDSAVFFAGDVNPDRPLMHEAADEGVIAARGALALLGHAVAPVPPRRVPLSIVFSDPDVASVGLSFDRLDPEQVVIGAAEGSGNGRSRILGAEDNLVRLYAARDTGRLLGASLLATHGEHLAHLLAWAVQRGDTVQDLLALPYYHPSIEEMVQSALKDALRQLAPSTS